ncbi:MAG TPA: cation diffusion facilitator family transporter [Solirubrobacteraceae bacterium]|jgi:cobalt-zinc-cadmium efflux system protein|nr:cation diffusion facilitator family transporter [Solirubrobacteraceae bacterium]
MEHRHAGHSHAGHSHEIAPDADTRALSGALALILALMVGEIAAGAVAHSLALLSDAAHMLTDAAALAISLVAMRLAARPARGAMTFGFRRVEILSAQANGVTLLVLAAFIAYEAVVRLFEPPRVHGALVLTVALAGALVNLAAVALLARANRRSLNIEGSFQHILTDLYGFLGTAAAAIVILASGFQRADPIASLLIAGLMVRAGWGLVRASARIFLEAAPEGLDPEAIGKALVAEQGVVEVHDLHVWEVTSGFPALSAHVTVGADADCHMARLRMQELLRDRFGVEHSTLQVDHEVEQLLEISAPGRVGGSAPR